MSRDNKLLISVFLLVLVFLLTPPCSSTRRDADDDESDDDVESSEFKVKGDKSEFKVKDDESDANSELLINLMKKNTGDVVASKRAKRQLVAPVDYWKNEVVVFSAAVILIFLLMTCMCVCMYYFERRPGESFGQTVKRKEWESAYVRGGYLFGMPPPPLANQSKNASQEARSKDINERYDMNDLKNEPDSKERLLGESEHSYGTDEATGKDKKSKFSRALSIFK